MVKTKEPVLVSRTDNTEFFERNDFLREIIGKVFLVFGFIGCTDLIVPLCFSLEVAS